MRRRIRRALSHPAQIRQTRQYPGTLRNFYHQNVSEANDQGDSVHVSHPLTTVLDLLQREASRVEASRGLEGLTVHLGEAATASGNCRTDTVLNRVCQILGEFTLMQAPFHIWTMGPALNLCRSMTFYS